METLFCDLSEFYTFDRNNYKMEDLFLDLQTFKDQFKEAYESIRNESYPD